MKNIQINKCQICGKNYAVGITMTLSNGTFKHLCKVCFAKWNKQNNEIDKHLKNARLTGNFESIEKIHKTITDEKK